MANCQQGDTFQCGSDSECSGQGLCEATGFCSFPDDGCDSGRRYGEFAGSLSEQCVQSEAGTSGPGMTTTTAGTTRTTAPLPTTGGASSSSSTSSGDETTVGVIETGVGSTSTSAGATTDVSSSSTGETTTTASSSTTGESNSDTSADGCTEEEFNVPPGPEWFDYGDQAQPSIDSGHMVLNPGPGGGPSNAGLRSLFGNNFTDADVRLEVTSVPDDAEVTTSLQFADSELPPTGTVALVILGGEVIAQTTTNTDGPVTILYGSAEVEPPLTLRLKVDEDELEMIVESAGGDISLATVTTPDWMVDATVSVNVGNPSTEAPEGVTLIDSFRVCPSLSDEP